MATLHEITHDSSTTLSDFYDTINDSDGAITVTPAAALGGSTNGLSIDNDAGASSFDIADSFANSTPAGVRWRVRVDLGGLTNAGSSAFFADFETDGLGGTDGRVQIEINGDGGGGFRARAIAFQDVAPTSRSTSFYAISSSGEVCLEIRSTRETADGNADGVLEFFIDGVSKESITDVENFNDFDFDRISVFFSSPAAISGTYKCDEFLLTDVPGTSTCTTPLTLAPMTKPASVNADGTFIYLALLDGGTPILTKIATDLLSDGTTVFNPGVGDNIGVQCGKFDANIVWIAGNFGGTDTIEKSENAGSSFVVKDPATFDPVTSFVVGPDSDDRVLVFADAGGSVASSSIQETTDNGASWNQKDSGLGFVSKAVERLDINVEEIVTGNEAGSSDNIHYSPNTGQDLEDYSTGFPTQDVTKVIIG
jgi:hypothetical protein